MKLLISVAGKFCLSLLVLCLVFQVMFVAMAYAVARFTEPAACQIGYSFPLPFAVCPGLGFGFWVDYALVLPGAVLGFPFILPSLLTDITSSLQPFVLVPLLIHLFGWGYLIGWLASPRRIKSRR
jgi:hypothetical protein